MAIRASRVTVTDSPTLLSVGRDRTVQKTRSLVVHNPGPETVYLGGPEVTTDDGFALGEGADFFIDLETEDELIYGVADVDQEVHVCQGGV